MSHLDANLSKLMQIYSAKSDAIAKNKGTLKVQESLEQPEIDIENLNEQLGKGNKDVLAELDKYGISYTLAERDNGYTVKFSYNGTNYTIAYYAPSESTNPTNPDTEPQDVSEPTTPTEETAEGKSKKAYYQKEQLMKAYGFTEDEINQYFTYEKFEDFNTEGYALKPDLIVNGELIYNISDLLKALGKGDPTKVMEGYSSEKLHAYGFTDKEIEQYFDFVEIHNGILDFEAWTIKKDLEINGQKINNLEELLTALGKGDPTKYSSEGKEDEPVKTDAQGTTSVPASETSEAEAPDTDPRFDYSVVDNLDTPVKDLYDSETLNDEYKSKIAGSGEKSINSGGYDNVLKELSNMKPQLKSYIKTELEAKGLNYDESIIDKYLNAYISKALSEGILMDGFYDKLASFSNTHNTENKELTIKDVINAIVEKIEEELTDKPEWEDKLLTSSAQEPFGDWYVTTHEYLLDTADYFLNDDEKKLKEAMLAAERDGWLVAQNKDEAADWIDTYAVRMKALIKSRSGSSLSDSQIDSIIKQAKEKTLESAEPITTLDQYDMGDVLKNFKELCETLENEILLK